MKFNHRKWLGGAGASILTAGLAGGSCQAGTPEPAKPNIVCIFSDEIDPSYLGGGFETPNLDRLMRDGLLFTNAFCTAPMCTPSRYSTLTGLYPSRCDHPYFRSKFPADEPACINWSSFIDENSRTLPRLLSAAGYVTGMAGKWHLGPHGVDWKEGLTAESDPSDPVVEALLRERQQEINAAVRRAGGFDYAESILWANWDEETVKALQFHNVPWFTKSALEFIEQSAAGDRPFLLYFTPTTIHGPPHHYSLERDLTLTPGGRDARVADYAPDRAALLAANENRPEWARHQHTGMADLDHAAGLILAKLKELNIESNTVVIYMPDHGIEPGKAVCYEKGFRVPLIIRWPGQIAPGGRTGAKVQNSDLFATLAAMAGVPSGDAATPDGYDFSGVLRDPASSGQRDYIYYEAGYARGLSDGHYKTIAFRPPLSIVDAMQKGEKAGAINYLDIRRQSHSQIALSHYPAYFDPDQFYDLQNDPYEQLNRAGDPSPQEQVVLDGLKQRLQNILDTMPNRVSLKPVPFLSSPEYRALCEEQKALGTDYINWLKRDHGVIVWPPQEQDQKK